MMKFKVYGLTILLVMLSPTLCFSESLEQAEDVVLTHLTEIYQDGKNELHVPLYTYHFPFAYDREVYDQLNRWPLGLGFGRGLDKDNGEWSGFYVMSFSDSHHDQQPSVVYSQTWPVLGQKGENVSLGLAAFITARSDTWNYFPFPGVLPVITASASESLKVTMVYVPGFTHGTGNVTLFTTTYRY
jgi:palmitoyl transferase